MVAAALYAAGLLAVIPALAESTQYPKPLRTPLALAAIVIATIYARTNSLVATCGVLTSMIAALLLSSKDPTKAINTIGEALRGAGADATAAGATEDAVED